MNVRGGPHNRNAQTNRRNPPSFLCVMVLGIVTFGHAQPFPSFLLDTTRYIGRDLRFSPGCIATAASHTGGIVAWTTWMDHVCASRLTGSMDLIDTIPQDVTGPILRASAAPAAACSDSGYAFAWHYGGGSMEYLWLALASGSRNKSGSR